MQTDVFELSPERGVLLVAHNVLYKSSFRVARARGYISDRMSLSLRINNV